jgi:CBS domain-containing protein
MGMEIPEQLQQVAEQLKTDGRAPPETVRTLLTWFGQKRRGRWVVNAIRAALRKLRLRTDPDFESTYIDGEIEFRLVGERREVDTRTFPVATESERASSCEGDGDGGKYSDPVVRIGMLSAANRSPVIIDRSASIEEATTLMLLNDFSQLPVMQGKRTVHGMISWKSIGSSRLQSAACDKVADCMEPAEELRHDTPLMYAMDMIQRHEVVLVRSGENEIQGLVTTADLSYQFDELARPFLLLGEIENHLRRLIEPRFTVAELADVKHHTEAGRTVEGVADLTFGEYLRLLQQPPCWDRLGLALDRKRFVEQLDRVRQVRNDVMHFSTDEIGEEELKLLEDTTRVLGQLR